MIKKDSRLDNWVKTGTWTEIEPAGTKIKVAYLDHYDLAKWGPIVQDPENLCFDLRVALQARMHIFPNEISIIKLGVAFDLPKGIGLKIYARSSLCKRGLILANGVGIIDPGYRGEIIAPLINFSDKTVFLTHGERILQAEIAPQRIASFQAIGQDELSDTNRGPNGFGSTGRF
jgi:dUTP pyrophosphatase